MVSRVSLFEVSFAEKFKGLIFYWFKFEKFKFDQYQRLILLFRDILNIFRLQVKFLDYINAILIALLFKVMIHVSTAYANCDKSSIHEQLYEQLHTAENLMGLSAWLSEDFIELLSAQLVRPKPNTYTYTKALSESLIVREMHYLPCAILRPSIIGSTWREPFAGWIDNFNGPSALFPAVGTGLLRTMYGHYEATCDLIPVDVIYIDIINIYSTRNCFKLLIQNL